MTQYPLPIITPGDQNYTGARLREDITGFSQAYAGGQIGATMPAWAGRGFLGALEVGGAARAYLADAAGTPVYLLRADTAFGEMTDAQKAAARVALGAGKQPVAIHVSGGTQTDLSTAFETRLSVQFAAVGTSALLTGGCRITVNGPRVGMHALLTIKGVTTPAYERTSTEISHYPAEINGAPTNLHRTLAVADLVPGEVYEARWRIKQDAAFAGNFPNEMSISGVAF